MLDYLAAAPRGIVLEKVYEERPIDTGIYGSFAVKPSLVGVPWILNVWKRDLTELPGLIDEIKSFYAGSHRQPARFLADHNVRYVVWSVRESRDLAHGGQLTADRVRFPLDGILSFARSHIGLWNSPMIRTGSQRVLDARDPPMIVFITTRGHGYTLRSLSRRTFGFATPRLVLDRYERLLGARARSSRHLYFWRLGTLGAMGVAGFG